VSRTAEKIGHPALVDRAGAPLGEAEISDRQRLGVVLQAAGLLSLCEVSGWRPAKALSTARIDADGLLVGVEVEAGSLDQGGPSQLAGLLRALFRSKSTIAGRGEARRSARALLRRWDGVLGRGSADRAVSDLLDEAAFLRGDAFEGARRALGGTLIRDGIESDWRAGRSTRAVDASGRSLAELLAAGRFRAVVAEAAARDGLGEEEVQLVADALYADGKAEAALATLGPRRTPHAEILRAKCQWQLGELGSARETVRRLEAAELTVDDLLAGGDLALRVLANSGEPDAARDWVARAERGARGAQSSRAKWLAALAALDRRDEANAERHAARARAEEPQSTGWLADEVEIQLALCRGDTAALLATAARALGSRRRRMPREAAGRLWNNIGVARSMAADFAAAERAFSHAARILRRCDGPLAVTLAGTNLADVRLRLGKLRGVDAILEESATHNRRAGNVRGRAEDELLASRRDLVAGDLELALHRVERELEQLEREGSSWARGRLAAIAARALGWLERPEAAAEQLARAGDALAQELEEEELPFVRALAGDVKGALTAARGGRWAGLAVPLVLGEAPDPSAWHQLDRLEPYRRARLVLDAELLAPGSAPRERRTEAAALFRRLGADRATEICGRREMVAWQALTRYFERPPADRGALESLLAAVGHPEAELLIRGPEGERRLAGKGVGTPPGSERSAKLGDGELVLRASEIDEPLRALFALFLRDAPSPAAEGGESGSILIGASPALRGAVDRLHRFAVTDLPVLLLGENGTGKELAASEIHRLSGRRRGPWVPVNCAGLSETLLLSELFGHVRGAFTGADQARAGVFESARGGTVFLDEIGDLPLVAQGSLLRVLQEHEIRRLGESMPRKVDARVVAATNRDLDAMVEQGRFRQDLYFRLKVATVRLPPLRERGRDVLVLAERFLESIRSRGREVRLSGDARRALEAHPWPGNVRELRNTLEAAAALADQGQIGVEHLDLDAVPSSGGEGDYHRLVESYRRRLIERALEASEGNLAGAARELGVTRQFLSQFVRKYGLKVR